MKPAAFDYVCAESVEHAIQVLAEAGGDGKILAGGQSLMPMMNFRLVRPTVVVDINRIAGLDRIERQGNRISIGALVRHRMTASEKIISDNLPVLQETMKHVAHLTVRNRGTFCGSVCHADPAAEMPMIAQLLDAEVHIVSRRGARTLPIGEFLTGSLMTALEPDELVTAIHVDALASGTGWGFGEFARRHGDYALAAVAVTMMRRDGVASGVRAAVMGVGETAMRVPEVEAVLEGHEASADLIGRAVDALLDIVEPNSDLHASADYRRHLCGELMRRALTDAWARSGGASLQ
jgi:carbon-monoxide dehydrogenase medium subunit